MRAAGAAPGGAGERGRAAVAGGGWDLGVGREAPQLPLKEGRAAEAGGLGDEEAGFGLEIRLINASDLSLASGETFICMLCIFIITSRRN